MNGFIRNIIPFSSVDGPGNRTAVFLQGCNFNCWYCHNPETIQLATSDNPIEGVQELTPEELCYQLRPYYDFTSGITFSGGECTVQGEYLIACCEQLKNEGQHILIDTNGHMNESTLNRLLPIVDGFMFDIKAFDEAEHLTLTGVGNKKVLANMSQVAEAGKLYEVRTVVVPETLNNEYTITSVAAFIAMHSPQTRYKLIKYRPHGVRESYLQHLSTPDNAYMGRLYKLAKEQGVKELILL